MTPEAPTRPAAIAAAALPVGAVAPDWATVDQYGAPIGTDEVSGRWSLMFFYPYSFTGVCTSELVELSAAAADLEAAGVTVVGLSCDSMYTQRIFADHESLRLRLAADHWPHGAIARSFGVFDDQAGCALRASFLVDGSGRVAWRQVNDIPEHRDIAEHLAAIGRSVR